MTQRITADLRRQIERGTLGPGALLPSEPEVARMYGVSRQSARTALQVLERDGLVVVRRGAGGSYGTRLHGYAGISPSSRSRAHRSNNVRRLGDRR